MHAYINTYIYEEEEVTLAKAPSRFSTVPLELGVEVDLATDSELVTADGSTCFAFFFRAITTNRAVRVGTGRLQLDRQRRTLHFVQNREVPRFLTCAGSKRHYLTRVCGSGTEHTTKHIHMHIHRHVHMHIHTHLQIYTHIHICTYIHICKYIHICICIYIYKMIRRKHWFPHTTISYVEPGGLVEVVVVIVPAFVNAVIRVRVSV